MTSSRRLQAAVDGAGCPLSGQIRESEPTDPRPNGDSLSTQFRNQPSGLVGVEVPVSIGGPEPDALAEGELDLLHVDNLPKGDLPSPLRQEGTHSDRGLQNPEDGQPPRTPQSSFFQRQVAATEDPTCR